VSNNGPPKNETLGKALLIIGLVALVVLIICYLATAIFVCIKPDYGIRDSPSLKKLFAALYACTLLLLARNIFRQTHLHNAPLTQSTRSALHVHNHPPAFVRLANPS